MKQLFLLAALLVIGFSNAQIGFGTKTPNASAALDITSTTKGFLLPRMTFVQKAAIATPTAGLQVWCTNCGCGGELQVFNGTFWTTIVSGCPTTVTACSQVWATQNLNVTTYRDGTPIPYVTNATSWAALTTGAYCSVNNDPANDAIYGKLYNWYAVNDSRGLAPTGYHVASDDEWLTISAYCLGRYSANKMRETGTTHWTPTNTGATNSSGFTALPAGYRYYDGTFNYIGLSAFWWTPQEFNAGDANFKGLNSFDEYYQGYINSKKHGLSVRCIRD